MLEYSIIFKEEFSIFIVLASLFGVPLIVCAPESPTVMLAMLLLLLAWLLYSQCVGKLCHTPLLVNQLLTYSALFLDWKEPATANTPFPLHARCLMNVPGASTSKESAAMSKFLEEQLVMQRSREIILKITETCWDQCASGDGKVTSTRHAIVHYTICCLLLCCVAAHSRNVP